MNTFLYNPLFQATREVFQLMLDLDSIQESLKNPGESAEPDENVNVAVGIVGDLQGRIVYRFSKETAMKAAEIMSGMDVTEVDDFVTSAICEIANIISGRTMTTLSEQQIVCDVLPPEVLGNKSEDGAEEASIHESFLLSTEIGSLELGLLLGLPARP